MPAIVRTLPATRHGERCRRFLEAWRRLAGGRCAVCRGWCAARLCAHCDAQFALPRPRCAGCGMPASAGAAAGLACAACRRRPPPWRRVVAGVDYAYPWAGLLGAFKFSQGIELAPVLCEPLRRRLAADADAIALASRRVVPVPLARERLRERGFNQAWELARRLAPSIGAAALPDALFRVRETPHQPGLARAQRAANLREAFVVSPHRAAWVRGASIALVDDVLTTGATARAATQALLAGGARDVEIWVVARAG